MVFLDSSMEFFILKLMIIIIILLKGCVFVGFYSQYS